jgi:hypothetical protein
LIVGERTPEHHAVAGDQREIGWSAGVFRDRPAGLRNQASDCILEVDDGGAHAVARDGIGDCVRLEPQHRERGSKAVREVGDELALGREEHADAVGEEVERLSDGGHLLRAVRLDALGQVAFAEPRGGRGE